MYENVEIPGKYQYGENHSVIEAFWSQGPTNTLNHLTLQKPETIS